MDLKLVDFETAKALKQAGFDWPAKDRYTDIGINQHISLRNWNRFPQWYSRPTVVLALRWLRGTKGIHITVDCSRLWDVWYFFIHSKGVFESYGSLEINSHDEAEAAGLKKALEILKTTA